MLGNESSCVYGPNKLEVVDVGEPEVTAGTVKVKSASTAICGTDLHEYYAGPIFVPTEPHRLTGRQMPLTMGHEFSASITDVGAGVTDYAAGDRSPSCRCIGAGTGGRAGRGTTTSASRSDSTA